MAGATYEFRKGKTQKFWAPEVKGKQLYLRFGAIGNVGQTRLKDFASAAEAKAALAAAVREKLADGYVLAGGPAGAKSAKATKPPRAALSPKRRAAMLALARELGTKQVVAEVTKSIDDTDAYLEEFLENYETLEDATHGEVPWLGLIESLSAHDRLAEVDWKECGTDVLDWLEQLGGAPAKRALKAARAEDDELDERYTEEALALFGRQLGAAKLALIALDKASDSYPLMVVPANRVAALQKLARIVGETITHYDGRDLEKLERERAKEAGKFETENPWKLLVAQNDYRATDGEADSVLWNLNHDDETIDHIRELRDHAPARDRPLIDMTIAIYDGSAAKLAKTTRDPKRLLAALRYLSPRVPEHRYERFAAAAILADRLNVKPDGKKLHMAILDACNVWNEGKATDAQLAKVPAAGRDRLARLGDAMLARQKAEGYDGVDDALRMLTTCGDAASLPVLAQFGERAMKARRDNEYDLAGPYPWDEAAKHIKRRLKR